MTADLDLIRRHEARRYYGRAGFICGALLGAAVGIVITMILYQAIIGWCINGG